MHEFHFYLALKRKYSSIPISHEPFKVPSHISTIGSNGKSVNTVGKEQTTELGKLRFKSQFYLRQTENLLSNFFEPWFF